MKLLYSLSIIGLFIISAPAPLRAQPQPEIDIARVSHIIEDRKFIGGFAISPEDIQEILNQRGEECDDELCLKDYRSEETGRTAAEIIHEYAHRFALHPYIIIATLQKENSLVTETDPQDWHYRTAMGYGCPDGADCDSDFFGFENQIRLGANLLRAGFDRACGDRLSHFRWRVNPHWAKGSLVTIDARPTYIGNCATASLYNYTPHRVDSAWIDTDGQYFYGNYNFVLIYQGWFE